MLNFSTRAVKNIDLFFLSDFTDMLSITQGCSRTLERNFPWSKELRILVKSKGQFYIKLHLPEYLVKQYCLQKCCKNLCLSFSYFTSLCQFIFFLVFVCVCVCVCVAKIEEYSPIIIHNFSMNTTVV